MLLEVRTHKKMIGMTYGRNLRKISSQTAVAMGTIMIIILLKQIQGHQQKLKHYFINDGMCEFDKDYEGEEQEISHSYLVSHDDIENYD